MTPVFRGVEPRLFRKKRNLLLAYASEIGSPVLRLAASAKSRGPSTDKSQWRKGLILSHTHIGDVLYRTCSLPALHEYLPKCEWTYAVSAGSAEVLAGNPHVAEVLPVIKGENSWDLVPGGMDQLKEREFDVVLCSNTLRHHPDLSVALSLGIPNRFAFSGKGFSGVINYPVAMGFPDSYASYFRTMVASALDRPPDWALRPRLFPSIAEVESATEIWRSLEIRDGEKVVACSLRTRQARGNWPERVLLSILEHARARAEFRVVLTGSGADKAHLDRIAEGLSYRADVVAGRGGILTLASLLKRCSALLTMDSGPRHIGNAMGIPVLFARNLSHSKREAGKYCETEIDLAPPVEYLEEKEVARVARSQPIGLLSDKLIAAISG